MKNIFTRGKKPPKHPTCYVHAHIFKAFSPSWKEVIGMRLLCLSSYCFVHVSFRKKYFSYFWKKKSSNLSIKQNKVSNKLDPSSKRAGMLCWRKFSFKAVDRTASLGFFHDAVMPADSSQGRRAQPGLQLCFQLYSAPTAVWPALIDWLLLSPTTTAIIIQSEILRLMK